MNPKVRDRQHASPEQENPELRAEDCPVWSPPAFELVAGGDPPDSTTPDTNMGKQRHGKEHKRNRQGFSPANAHLGGLNSPSYHGGFDPVGGYSSGRQLSYEHEAENGMRLWLDFYPGSNQVFERFGNENPQGGRQPVSHAYLRLRSEEGELAKAEVLPDGNWLHEVAKWGLTPKQTESLFHEVRTGIYARFGWDDSLLLSHAIAELNPNKKQAWQGTLSKQTKVFDLPGEDKETQSIGTAPSGSGIEVLELRPAWIKVGITGQGTEMAGWVPRSAVSDWARPVVLDSVEITANKNSIAEAVAAKDEGNLTFLLAWSAVNWPDKQSASLEDRISLIKALVGGESFLSRSLTWVGGVRERGINDLISSTPPEQISGLLHWMTGSRGHWYKALHERIHGDEFKVFAESLASQAGNLSAREQSPDSLSKDFIAMRSEGIEHPKVIPFGNPAFNSVLKRGTTPFFHWTEEDGESLIRVTYAHPETGIYTRKDFEPLEIVGVLYQYNEAETGGQAGGMQFMPALRLFQLDAKARRQTKGELLDVGFLLMGAGELRAAFALGKTSIRALFAAADLAFASLDVTIRTLRPTLEESEAGREFLKVWEVTQGVFALAGIGYALKEGGEMIAGLRKSWKELQAARAPGTDKLAPIIEESLKGWDAVRIAAKANQNAEQAGAGTRLAGFLAALEAKLDGQLKARVNRFTALFTELERRIAARLPGPPGTAPQLAGAGVHPNFAASASDPRLLVRRTGVPLEDDAAALATSLQKAAKEPDQMKFTALLTEIAKEAAAIPGLFTAESFVSLLRILFPEKLVNYSDSALRQLFSSGKARSYDELSADIQRQFDALSPEQRAEVMAYLSLHEFSQKSLGDALAEVRTGKRLDPETGFFRSPDAAKPDFGSVIKQGGIEALLSTPNLDPATRELIEALSKERQKLREQIRQMDLENPGRASAIKRVGDYSEVMAELVAEATVEQTIRQVMGENLAGLKKRWSKRDLLAELQNKGPEQFMEELGKLGSAGEFDQVWEVSLRDGDSLMLVIESKGGSSSHKGKSRLVTNKAMDKQYIDQRVEQLSQGYLLDVAMAMETKGKKIGDQQMENLGADVLLSHSEGNVKYLLFNQRFDPKTGVLSESKFVEYDTYTDYKNPKP